MKYKLLLVGLTAGVVFGNKISGAFAQGENMQVAGEEPKTQEKSGLQYKPAKNGTGVTFGIRSVDAPVLSASGITGTVVFKLFIKLR